MNKPTLENISPFVDAQARLQHPGIAKNGLAKTKTKNLRLEIAELKGVLDALDAEASGDGWGPSDEIRTVAESTWRSRTVKTPPVAQTPEQIEAVVKFDDAVTKLRSRWVGRYLNLGAGEVLRFEIVLGLPDIKRLKGTKQTLMVQAVGALHEALEQNGLQIGDIATGVGPSLKDQELAPGQRQAESTGLYKDDEPIPRKDWEVDGGEPLPFQVAMRDYALTVGKALRAEFAELAVSLHPSTGARL